VKSLETAIQGGFFQPISSPSLDVVRKVIAAGRIAAGMPPAAKKWLAQI
jgi:hypothetical protein